MNKERMDEIAALSVIKVMDVRCPDLDWVESLRTAVPELLAALRERDAVLSEREQQIIGRNAGLIALHNSVYSLTSERDALRSRCENAEALYERERTRVAALEAVREAAQARGAGEMSDYKAKAEAVINLAWNKIPNRGHIHESVYHELRNEVAHALRDATVNGMERASRFWRYCSREGAEHNVIEAIEHERKAP